MRQTNRALNRILLALLGIALLGAGAAVIAAGILPGAADTWTAVASSAQQYARDLVRTAPLPEPVRSWWIVAGLGVLLLGAALSAAWLASQGGGRTPRLAEQLDGSAQADGSDAATGRTVVDVGLVSAAIREALSGNRDVLATSVSAWESRRGTALRLRLEARKGSSPRELADTAEQLIREMDALLGHPIPVLVRITSGARTQVSGSRRAR
ncbi:hypothetical protein HP499_18960 [Paenarthrobacter sp. CM16]|uniref:hypothetical protein n=1 Tax=Paenarthrobacter sp. CM16 TaxID=2738447 RepID=UPI001553B3FF|nr:hypothetical protein [Paenarthrobacter sp. CM16]NQD89869.1 hypothetical protein [Paenarthrobacter sp. CM16]